jgi:hypothetical protein
MADDDLIRRGDVLAEVGVWLNEKYGLHSHVGQPIANLRHAIAALPPAPDAVEAIREMTETDHANIIAHLSPELTPTGPLPNRNSLMMEVVRLRNQVKALVDADAGGVEGLQTAGRDMLALHDGFLSGADVDRPAANRLHLAASFGAQAFAVCPIPDARPAAMIRAIALALIDPMHSDLDYLRRVNMARPVEAPMMTDLMVDPENIDDFLAANPLPPTHVGDSEQPETAINAAPVDVLVKAAEAFRQIVPKAMQALMQQGRDGLLLADEIHKADDKLRAALAALEPAEAGGVEAGPCEKSVYDRTGLPPVTVAPAPVDALVKAAEPFAYEIDAPAMEDDRSITVRVTIGDHRRLRAALAAIREGRNG